MENKVVEIFIPGPAGRLEAKYYKSKKKTSPIALIYILILSMEEQ